MTAVLWVAVPAAATTGVGAVEVVFPAGQLGVDAVTRRLVTLIGPGFLAEVGWAAQRLVMCPAGRPLLGRPVCRIEGCSATAPSGTRICFACLAGWPNAGWARTRSVCCRRGTRRRPCRRQNRQPRTHDPDQRLRKHPIGAARHVHHTLHTHTMPTSAR